MPSVAIAAHKESHYMSARYRPATPAPGEVALEKGRLSRGGAGPVSLAQRAQLPETTKYGLIRQLAFR